MESSSIPRQSSAGDKDKCNYCHKLGHWASECRKKQRDQVETEQRTNRGGGGGGKSPSSSRSSSTGTAKITGKSKPSEKGKVSSTKGNTSKDSKSSKNPRARSYKATTDHTEDSDNDEDWDDSDEEDEISRRISWPLLISFSSECSEDDQPADAEETVNSDDTLDEIDTPRILLENGEEFHSIYDYEYNEEQAMELAVSTSPQVQMSLPAPTPLMVLSNQSDMEGTSTVHDPYLSSALRTKIETTNATTNDDSQETEEYLQILSEDGEEFQFSHKGYIYNDDSTISLPISSSKPLGTSSVDYPHDAVHACYNRVDDNITGVQVSSVQDITRVQCLGFEDPSAISSVTKVEDRAYQDSPTANMGTSTMIECDNADNEDLIHTEPSAIEFSVPQFLADRPLTLTENTQGDTAIDQLEYLHEKQQVTVADALAFNYYVDHNQLSTVSPQHNFTDSKYHQHVSDAHSVLESYENYLHMHDCVSSHNSIDNAITDIISYKHINDSNDHSRSDKDNVLDDNEGDNARHEVVKSPNSSHSAFTNSSVFVTTDIEKKLKYSDVCDEPSKTSQDERVNSTDIFSPAINDEHLTEAASLFIFYVIIVCLGKLSILIAALTILSTGKTTEELVKALHSFVGPLRSKIRESSAVQYDKPSLVAAKSSTLEETLKISVNWTSDYVPQAERGICTVKAVCRKIISGLPYKLTVTLQVFMVAYAVNRINLWIPPGSPVTSTSTDLVDIIKSYSCAAIDLSSVRNSQAVVGIYNAKAVIENQDLKFRTWKGEVSYDRDLFTDVPATLLTLREARRDETGQVQFQSDTLASVTASTHFDSTLNSKSEYNPTAIPTSSAQSTSSSAGLFTGVQPHGQLPGVQSSKLTSATTSSRPNRKSYIGTSVHKSFGVRDIKTTSDLFHVDNADSPLLREAYKHQQMFADVLTKPLQDDLFPSLRDQLLNWTSN